MIQLYFGSNLFAKTFRSSMSFLNEDLSSRFLDVILEYSETHEDLTPLSKANNLKLLLDCLSTGSLASKLASCMLLSNVCGTYPDVKPLVAEHFDSVVDLILLVDFVEVYRSGKPGWIISLLDLLTSLLPVLTHEMLPPTWPALKRKLQMCAKLSFDPVLQRHLELLAPELEQYD